MHIYITRQGGGGGGGGSDAVAYCSLMLTEVLDEAYISQFSSSNSSAKLGNNNGLWNNSHQIQSSVLTLNVYNYH